MKPKLTFIKKAGKNKHRQQLSLYLCSCGNKKIIAEYKVKEGSTISCGCFKKVRLGRETITHGLSKHTLYNTYYNILQRCYNPKAINYGRYGAKGVMMCNRWIKDFVLFYNWCIKNGWKEGLNIDKDIKGNGLVYSPDSCSIVTVLENNRAKKLQLKK